MSWVLDLDGVLWLADQPVPGAPEAVGRLRAAGRSVLFLTNNSSLTIAQYVAKLASMGVPAAEEEVVTSAQAAASLLAPGSSALVCGGPGVREALVRRGVVVLARPPADAVVLGWDRSFDFSRLALATEAVLGGSRLVGTNGDATYPTPGGVLPGAGALLAAVSYATGAEPTVAGKPHRPTIELLAARAEAVEVVVGDRPSTDGRLAAALGVPFALVHTGVTPPDHGDLDPVPDVEGADLGAVVDAALARSGASSRREA